MDDTKKNNLNNLSEIVDNMQEKSIINNIVIHEEKQKIIDNLSKSSIAFIYALWRNDQKFLMNLNLINLNLTQNELQNFYDKAIKSYQNIPEFKYTYDHIKNIFKELLNIEKGKYAK